LSLSKDEAIRPPSKERSENQIEDTKLQELKDRLAKADYVADDALAVAVDLAMRLGRPLLLEGAAGVGKTEVAKALAIALDARLIRLQCYEGLDANAAIYEWNYQRQLLAIKAHEHSNESADEIERHVFSEDYLLKRPLLEAISQDKPPVLLIDEIDRADTEFEAYLLELLSDFQITVPEIGTIAARSVPHVILTSNGTRELSDALRRRCLYSYVEFPDLEKELAILKARLPDVDDVIGDQIVRFVQELRREELEKVPGIAETLDWAAALAGLDIQALDRDPEQILPTLICLLKTERDLKSVTREVVSRLAGKAA
jgi:MoxR-like ATPase